MDGLRKLSLKVFMNRLFCFHLSNFFYFNFKIIIVSCLMRETLTCFTSLTTTISNSTTGLSVNVLCMPSVTGYYYYNILYFGYADIIICKWEINGVDHYDTKTQADTDCAHIGYSLGLGSTSYVSLFKTTPTNDQAMLIKYLDSSVGAR